jgi:DNA-directed RNA polymerase subunit RPC12/RpoP
MAWTARSFRANHADAELICPHCDHRVIWQPFAIELAYKEQDISVEEMSRRFRCKRCNGKGAAISALIRRR